ncbi:MAG: cadmium-translocating P-type ATPase [Rubellimicrobium sp.]|nr:cadmium-translocating P-type ATPase [Rubellimicrobium sp.]
MDCADCAATVTTALARIKGVHDVEVALMAERLTARLDGADAEAVEAAVRGLGYGITRRDPHGHDHAHHHGDDGDLPWYRTGRGRLVIATGALLAGAWLLAQLLPASWGGWLFILACLIGVAPIARHALAALRAGRPFTIESLMTVAAVGALFIGAAEEAAVVVFLFALGEMLEGVAANRARAGIRGLAALIPRSAVIETGSGLREVDADTLAPGQIALVRPGERIPADGEIVEGTGGIDESPVTGESVPVTRGPGAAVLAGSIATDAALRIRVTREASDNTIARIIDMVERAEASRAPTDRFIDRFSRWYMPAVVALAVVVAIIPPLLAGQDWGTWVYRALALLLIGCPCALVISVPASIASALSAGARHGLLFKGGAALESAATLRHVAFDKTGTLTMGRPEVTDIVPLGDEDAARVLALAAAVEQGSSHPLAAAILRRAGDMALPQAREARVLPGRGMAAEVEGLALTVAAPRHAQAAGVLPDTAQAEALEAEGKTVAVLFDATRALALIALQDTPRPDAAAGVAWLRAMGLQPVILTGDNPRAAAAIAGLLGTDHRAQMLPEDKLAAIAALSRDGGVMMVGDGINDAPALKAADVGVAMGSGTEVALETADAAILRDRVGDVAEMIALARRAMGNIHQNIAIALGLKGVFLVTTVLGITGLWIAVLADTGATVLVTLNALRLLAWRGQSAPGSAAGSSPATT